MRPQQTANFLQQQNSYPSLIPRRVEDENEAAFTHAQNTAHLRFNHSKSHCLYMCIPTTRLTSCQILRMMGSSWKNWPYESQVLSLSRIRLASFHLESNVQQASHFHASQYNASASRTNMSVQKKPSPQHLNKSVITKRWSKINVMNNMKQLKISEKNCLASIDSSSLLFMLLTKALQIDTVAF